jgi:hypothetical protein
MTMFLVGSLPSVGSSKKMCEMYNQSETLCFFSCMRGIEIHVLAGIKSSSVADFSVSVTSILQINVSI